MVFIGLLTNLATLALISFGGKPMHLPITVILILVDLFVTAGVIDTISDLDTICTNYDTEEKIYLVELFANRPTLFFKILLFLIFGSSALS